MHVGVDHSGDHGRTFEVDDLRLAADVATDGGVGADGENAIAGDRNRLGFGRVAIHGHDVGVLQYEIGLLARGSLASGKGCHNQNKNAFAVL